MKEIELIQDYLDGSLSEPDKSSFESRLEQDEALQSLLKNAQVARRISSGLMEVDVREALDTHRKKKRVKKLIYAGLILLVLSAVFYFSRSMLQRETVHYATVYEEPLWPVSRGVSDDLGRFLYEFRSGAELQVVKDSILKIEDLSPDLKNYWISEMFLAREFLDSATFYLPILPAGHIKFERTTWMKKYITDQKDN